MSCASLSPPEPAPLKHLITRADPLRRWVVASWSQVAGSRFAHNSLWLTGLAGVERLASVAQTILVARALGITEYGVYGLLMGTIGLVASILGLQMGLTAAVFIARYRESEKARAAVVIRVVMRFAWVVAGAIALLSLPVATPLSASLLRSDQHGFAVVVGGFYIGAVLLSGVQEGVLQGFDAFRSIARVRLFTSLLTLAAIYPAASYAGLAGVMLVLVGGLALNFGLLRVVVAQRRREHGIPERGEGLRFADVIFKFSLPSVLINLVVGAITWFGTYLLSRQSGGFEELAIVNAGLQWRGPILLMASSVGTVAIPTFSRYAAQSNDAAAARLRRILLRVNFAAAFGISLALALLSRPLLSLYGSDFTGGELVFCLLVLSTVPQVLVNVYMQGLVGRGLLWRSLALHGPALAVALLGYVLLVPRHLALGYAGTLFASALTFLLFLVWFDRRNPTGRWSA